MPAPQQKGIIRQIIQDSDRAVQPCFIVIGSNKDGGNDHAFLHYNHPQHAKEDATATYHFFLQARPETFGVVIIPKLHKLDERRELKKLVPYHGPSWARQQDTELKKLVPYHGPPWARQQDTNFCANTSRFANTNTCAHQNTHNDQIQQMQKKMEALQNNVAELHNAMKEGAWSVHQGEVLHDIMGDYKQSTKDFST